MTNKKDSVSFFCEPDIKSRRLRSFLLECVMKVGGRNSFMFVVAVPEVGGSQDLRSPDIIPPFLSKCGHMDLCLLMGS